MIFSKLMSNRMNYPILAQAEEIKKLREEVQTLKENVRQTTFYKVGFL